MVRRGQAWLGVAGKAGRGNEGLGRDWRGLARQVWLVAAVNGGFGHGAAVEVGCGLSGRGKAGLGLKRLRASTVCEIEAESLEDAQRQAALGYEIAHASAPWVSGGGDLEIAIEVEPEPADVILLKS